jgi:hypothetical protein
MKQAAFYDFDFIERDSFELRIIQDRFYRQYELEPEFEIPEAFSQESSAAFGQGNLRLHLKSQISGGNYYLMGILTNHPGMTRVFFNSYNTNQSDYPEAIVQNKDTALYYTPVSPVAPNKFV